MAATVSARPPRPENVGLDAPSALYVDDTCIDCACCRWMAPETFGRAGGQSAVVAQPASSESRGAALRALLSCPTASIHARSAPPEELRAAAAGLPAPVAGVTGVHLCGWNARASYGAAAWLIARPAGGNVMVDSPRFSPVLARNIERLGGVQYIFLTHRCERHTSLLAAADAAAATVAAPPRLSSLTRAPPLQTSKPTLNTQTPRDDVADHAAWAAHFGARRIIHELEVNGGTAAAEIKLFGEARRDAAPRAASARATHAATFRMHMPLPVPSKPSPLASPTPPPNRSPHQGPWALPDGGDDVEIAFAPGHTRGHAVLYYTPARALFTGAPRAAVASRCLLASPPAAHY